MSLLSKVEYLQGTKQAIKTAIQNKGVAVSNSDTFRSYAGKIGQIKTNGVAGGNAEYVVAEIDSLQEFPTIAPSEGNYLFMNNKQEYLASSAGIKIYTDLAYGYGVDLLFDQNLDTQSSNANKEYPLFFYSEKSLAKIKAYVINSSNSPYFHLYGTNDADKQFNLGEMLLIASQPFNDTTGGSWQELSITDNYKYYALYFGTQDPTVSASIFINEIKFEFADKTKTCVLTGSNMTPIISVFQNDYMRITTQDWYNGATVVASQELICKPVSEGGCLVDYVDDGSAVILKLFYKDGQFLASPNDIEGGAKVATLSIPQHTTKGA